MNNGKEMILSSQLMFCIGCFIQSSTLLTGFVAGVSKHESWISVIAGYGVAMLFVTFYARLAGRFPGKSIVQITEEVFGPVLGKGISCLYIWFFFSLTILNCEDMGFFVNNFIMPETPTVAILLLFVFVCAWAVRKGAETVARFGQIFLIAAYAIVSLYFLLLLKDMSLRNLQPLLSLPVMKYVQSVHIIAAIPFGELFAFFMLFPNVKDPEKIGSALRIGLTLGAVHLLVIVFRDVAVLGAAYTIAVAPSFQVTRLINVGNVLTRMEFFYEIAVIILLFFKVSILFFATAKAVAQTFHLKSYRALVSPLGALIICVALIPFQNFAEGRYWGSYIAPFYSTFFELILPLLTLLVAWIRSLQPAGKGAEAQ